MTNHTYFNLAGEGSGDILDTKLIIDADYISKIENQLYPNGEKISVKNTPYDFTKEKTIGQDIDIEDSLLKLCGGYDFNYILNGKGLRKVASAFNEKTGIRLNVITDNVAMQFYSGNFVVNQKGKNGHIYNKRQGFCLETQNMPNDINLNPNSSTILRKDEIYNTTTIYEFTIDN